MLNIDIILSERLGKVRLANNWPTGEVELELRKFIRVMFRAGTEV